MPLSQSLGALLPPQHSMFAQSFGSRIRGWIVNYSRSTIAPKRLPPPRPSLLSLDLLLTHLHGDLAGIFFFFSPCMCPLPVSYSASSTLHPLFFILPTSERPIGKQPGRVTWSGSFDGASHWVKGHCLWSCDFQSGFCQVPNLDMNETDKVIHFMGSF